MKKFKFSLDSVMDYKNQVLEEKKREHALTVQAVAAQEHVVRSVKRQFAQVNTEFNQKKEIGILIVDARGYENHLRILQKKIEDETIKLEQLKAEEEKKKDAVVEAKKEVSSLEKLKERRLEEYSKDMQKEEELFIEELVSFKRVGATGI